MIEAKKIEFYIYAESDEEIARCRQSICNMIEEYRQRGIAITADKISKAIANLNNSNTFIKNQIDKFLS